MGDVSKGLWVLLGCFYFTAGFACEYPDEGNMPLRRAVARVEMLPEVDAWARAVRRNGAVTQVLVLAGESERRGGRCYWPVEVRAEGRLWRRFLVTPDGKRLIDAGAPPAAALPPAASTPEAPKPESR